MKLKNIFLLTGFLSILLFNLNCAQDEPDGPTVFNNVTQIYAHRSGTEAIFEDGLPDEAVYLVVGFFIPGTTITVDSNNSITNAATDWAGGNHTGLPGIGRNKAIQYYNYNTTTKDFTGGAYTPTPSTGVVWAVWGYNSEWVVICSTDQKTW